MKAAFALIVTAMAVGGLSAQQPGELGCYQGFKVCEGRWAQTVEGYRFVPTYWAQAAMFCFHNDAEKWYNDQTDSALVIDNNGLVIFAPKNAPANLQLPRPILPFRPPAPPVMVRSVAPSVRQSVHGRTAAHQFTAPIMPSAFHSRTKIPGVIVVRTRTTTR